MKKPQTKAINQPTNQGKLPKNPNKQTENETSKKKHSV